MTLVSFCHNLSLMVLGVYIGAAATLPAKPVHKALVFVLGACAVLTYKYL